MVTRVHIWTHISNKCETDLQQEGLMFILFYLFFNLFILFYLHDSFQMKKAGLRNEIEKFNWKTLGHCGYSIDYSQNNGSLLYFIDIDKKIE